MKKRIQLLALIVALCAGGNGNAQTLGDYTFSTGIDASKWITITDSTNLLGPWFGSTYASTLQDIGFVFPFAGSYYTQYSVNCDGNLRLGPWLVGSSGYYSPFDAYTCDINSPKINFFGTRGAFLDSIHYIFAENTVDSRNRPLLVIEFCLGMGGSNSTNRTQKYKWQVHLYPSGNIVGVFSPEAPSMLPNTYTQRGLCYNIRDGWVINSNNTATHFGYSSSTRWSTGQWPAPNTYYAFTRPYVRCPNPFSVTLNNVTPTTATLTVTPIGNETSWLATVSPAIGGTTEYTMSDTTLNLTGLSPNTAYTINIHAICSPSSNSNNVPLTFQTPCNPKPMNYFTDFEHVTTSTSGNTGVLPEGWIFGAWEREMDDTRKAQVRYNPTVAHSGNYCLGLSGRGYTTMPAFQSSFDNLKLSFWLKKTSSSYLLIVGTMDNPYDTNTFVPIDTINNTSSNSYVYHELDLSRYAGHGQYIAFHNTALPTTSSLTSLYYIDDIDIVPANSCQPPETITASNILHKSANVTWDGTGNATQWQYTFNSGAITTVTGTVPHLTFTGLSPQTKQTVRVRSINAPGDTSVWNTYLFYTLCETTVPYTMGFEYEEGSSIGEGTKTDFVDCMIRLNNATQYFGHPYVTFTGNCNHTPDGDRGLFWYNCATSPSLYSDYQAVVLPAIDTQDIPIRDMQLSFWALNTYSQYDPAIQVGIMTNPNDINTFVAVDTVHIDTTYTWDEYRVSFESYTGNGVFVTLKADRPTSSWTAYLDDLTLKKRPDCPHVLNLSVDSITTNSAYISWIEAGSATSWEVQYLTTGASSSSTVSVTVSDSNITLSDLQANTEYTVWVIPVCTGVNDTFHTSFRTRCNPLDTLPYTMGFESSEGVSAGETYLTDFVNCMYRITDGMYNNYFPYVINSSTCNHTPSGGRGLYWRGPSSFSHTGSYQVVALPNVDTLIYPIRNLQLSFWSRGTAYDQPYLIVGVMTNPYDINTFTAVDTITILLNNLWTEYVTTFDNYHGNGTYVAVMASGTDNSWTISIDDFTLNTKPACPRVQNIAVHNIAPNSVEISWHETGTATSWDIQYLQKGKSSSYTVSATAYDTTFTLTDLLDNTEYTVWIAPVCNEATEFEQTTFRTLCFALDTLPYTMGFEYSEGVNTGGSTSTSFVNCMYRVNNAAIYYGYPYVARDTSFNHTPGGNRGLYWAYSGPSYNHGDYKIVALPGVDPNAYNVRDLQLSFWSRNSYSTNYVTFYVGVMDNPYDVNSFVAIDSFTIDTKKWTEYVTSFEKYTGNGTFVALKTVATTSSRTAYVDDLTLSVRPKRCGIPVNELPYTDTFDPSTTSTSATTGVEPDCWVLVHQDVPITDDYKPMIYCKSDNAHSGKYSLLINKRGIYAMPSVDTNVNTLQLSFYLKQQYAKYRLQVGVLSDLSDPSSFTPVVTLDNGTTGVEYVSVDFSSYSGDGRYIAFRNILAPGYSGDFSCNFIDDLTLNVRTQQCGISVSDLPYTDNFDSYTASTEPKTFAEPPCWTLAHQDVSITDAYKPMVYYNSSNAHSGNYSLILNKRGIYAMPKVDINVNRLKLTFYLKQPQAKYRLQVGVMTDLGDATTFVPVATLNNSSTSASVLRSVSFASYSGTGRYIAFRNILASGYNGDFSCNYIDDLTLALNTSVCTIDESDLPYTDNFDSYTSSTTAKTGVEPDCWTLVHKDVPFSDEYLPMVYYKPSYARSGNYSLLLNKRCIYAMPYYDGDMSTLQLRFYLRQPQAKYRLQVGILTDISDPTTFTPVTTLNNTSTSSSVLRTVNFSSYTGTGHYIAFRNILASGQTGDYSLNYIDDLNLTVASKGDFNEEPYTTDSRHLSLYPNPTTGILTVEADEEVVRVDVYDYTGRNVATFQGQTTLDLSRLASGLYTLRVTLPERIEVRRVVKQ